MTKPFARMIYAFFMSKIDAWVQLEISAKNIKQLGEKAIIINPYEIQSKVHGPVSHLNTNLKRGGHYFHCYSTNELSNSQAEVENGVAYKKNKRSRSGPTQERKREKRE